MKLIDNTLGKALRAKDVAQYLGLAEKTIIKYYRELGGIRLGRHYQFFEKEVINAIQKRTEMDSPSTERGTPEGQTVSDEERSQGVGSQDAEKARKRVGRDDQHHLLV